MGYKVQHGDTLVEVLMAIVIMSMVIVGALTIMSRGLAAAQIAVEHSEVRLSINSQIEQLRFARDSYLANPADPSGAQWKAIVIASNTTPITYDSSCTTTSGKQAFYMTKNGSQVTRNNYTPATPPTVATAGTGLWVESVLSPSGISPAYVDFVIRACWPALGTSTAQQAVTAQRLYDPTR
ncbi:MAG TPA: prepilin-type N-terminal cleavage/methylation domain-containing protein [Candidatus Saccharimonas sp.]|nr:prepilin-type N-terminal cleavage/methylation domain-containing protein [Candidatus Saccharimonas sp.]